MRRHARTLSPLLLAAACLSLAGAECPASPDRPDFDGGLDGGSVDRSVPPVDLFDWSISRGFTEEAPSPMAPLATAVGPGGRIAVGYYKEPDPVVPYQQSLGLAETLQQICGADRVTLELFDGFEHGDHRLASPVNITRVLDFIDLHLKPAG